MWLVSTSRRPLFGMEPHQHQTAEGVDPKIFQLRVKPDPSVVYIVIALLRIVLQLQYTTRYNSPFVPSTPTKLGILRCRYVQFKYNLDRAWHDNKCKFLLLSTAIQLPSLLDKPLNLSLHGFVRS